MDDEARVRALGLAALVTASLLLQGCAIAVVPVIAASTIARQQFSRTKRVPAAPARTDLPAPRPSLQINGLTALPAPADPVQQFVSHALAAASLGSTPSHSMVLSPQSTLERVSFMPCAAGQPLAVALDAGLGAGSAFMLGLRQLRAFDVEVLWIADEDQVPSLRAALKGKGHAAGGDGPILTTSPGFERKELVRREATRAFCIVAVAGARRSDVEELYAFLRKPDAALGLERYWNAGWFVLPSPSPIAER
jgi:hypothetical protein